MVLYLAAFTIHNAEEALFLPEWARRARPVSVEVDRRSFLILLAVLTLLSYGAGLAFLLRGSAEALPRLLFLGLAAATLVNVFVPHLAGSVAARRLMPGAASGVALVLPASCAVLAAYTRGVGELLAAFAAGLGLTLLFAAAYFILLRPRLRRGNLEAGGVPR